LPTTRLAFDGVAQNVGWNTCFARHRGGRFERQLRGGDDARGGAREPGIVRFHRFPPTARQYVEHRRRQLYAIALHNAQSIG
jgi:hypothetical protein